MSTEYDSISKNLCGCGTAIENLQMRDCRSRQGNAIPALGRLRQKDLDLRAILGYTASFRLAWATWVDPILKQITHQHNGAHAHTK